MKVMINGRSLAGKDVANKILCEKYGFITDSFAAPIYDIARDIFGMESKDRELLISIGQKMREINPDVWINALLKRNEGQQHIVVSDVRQANEYIRLKEEGFIPLRVTSSLENRIKRYEQRDGGKITDEVLALWESEGEIGADGFEYYEITNDGTYEELEEQALKFMRINVEKAVQETIRKSFNENIK